MPRRARLNVPGGLYHIIARGIERRSELMGGGVLRFLGRLPGQWAGVRRDELDAFNDRILGSGGFVETVLKESEKNDIHGEIKGMTLEEVSEWVGKAYGITQEELTRKGRRESVTRAKAVLIYLGVLFKGQSCRRMGEFTAMTVQSASKANSRGETFIQTKPELLKLIDRIRPL